MPGRARRAVIAANLAYAAVLLVLGVVPDVPEIAKEIPDYTSHALAYGVHGALLFALFLPLTGRGTAAVLAAAGATLYGGFVEALQLLQPARSVEILDIAANALGAGAAAAIAFLLTQSHERRDGL